MNKATGAYQLALAEARKAGHPVLAVVIGRAISGAFLCHGLQADRILSLSSKYNTMIHVMPLTSIARITKQDLERLTELSKSNPVFAAGPDFFFRLGGIEEIIEIAGSDARIRSPPCRRNLPAQGGRPIDRAGSVGTRRTGRRTRRPGDAQEGHGADDRTVRRRGRPLSECLSRPLFRYHGEGKPAAWSDTGSKNEVDNVLALGTRISGVLHPVFADARRNAQTKS